MSAHILSSRFVRHGSLNEAVQIKQLASGQMSIRFVRRVTGISGSHCQRSKRSKTDLAEEAFHAGKTHSRLHEARHEYSMNKPSIQSLEKGAYSFNL